MNLSADHLERHKNINNYARTKLKLIYNQDKNNHSYIEKNNPIIKKILFIKILNQNLNSSNYNKENHLINLKILKKEENI